MKKEEFITLLHEIGIIDNVSGAVSRNLDSVIAEAISSSEAAKAFTIPVLFEEETE